MIEKVEAHFFKNGVEERKETAGEEGLLENGRRELEILATDTRVKLVYDIPSGSPAFTFLTIEWTQNNNNTHSRQTI